jgi:hypothetical protein
VEREKKFEYWKGKWPTLKLEKEKKKNIRGKNSEEELKLEKCQFRGSLIAIQASSYFQLSSPERVNTGFKKAILTILLRIAQIQSANL